MSKLAPSFYANCRAQRPYRWVRGAELQFLNLVLFSQWLVKDTFLTLWQSYVRLYNDNSAVGTFGVSEATLRKVAVCSKRVLPEPLCRFLQREEPLGAQTPTQPCLLLEKSLSHLFARDTLATSCFIHSGLPNWDN